MQLCQFMHKLPVVKAEHYTSKVGNGTFRLGLPSVVVSSLQHCKSVRWDKAFSHKLDVGERRFLASYGTLTTAFSLSIIPLGIFNKICGSPWANCPACHS